MSENPAADVGRIAARLRELADELAFEGLADERAEALAREAADLVGEAGNELERALREPAE